jgi:Protein of unknown function (DUF2934)
LDIHTRRQKQQALMTELLERKIRLHAQHIYDKRGQAEGLALQDWVQAESEVLSRSILAPLYRRTRPEDISDENTSTTSPQFAVDSSVS